MITKTASAVDLAREEVEAWERELAPEERANLRMLGGLLACIVRWRTESHITGDLSRVARCNALLETLSRA